MKCILPICVALLIAGCQTTQQSADFTTISSERALIRWHRKGSSLVYEAVCARSPTGAVLVRLYKQSPAALGEFRLDPDDNFMAKGRLAGRGWAGAAASAPIKFSSWAAFLAAYRESAKFSEGARQFQTAAARVSYTKADNQLRALSLSNTETREVISAVFN
jgi:hypothetical protein